MQVYPFKPSHPDPSQLSDHKSFISSVKEQFADYQASGYFNQMQDDQVLIYDVTLGDQVHTGIICCLDSSEITAGNVIRHEMTLKEKEMMMMKLIQDRNANIKPILLTVPDSDNITSWVSAHRHDDTMTYYYNAAESHTITPVKSKKGIQQILKIFKEEIPRAYIADGHHRCFCIKYLTDKDPDKYGKVMVAFFPFNDLLIKPYNRIIEFSEKMTIKKLTTIIEPFAKVKRVKKFTQSESRKVFYAYCDGHWIECTWKKALLKRIDGGSLDLFNHHILSDGLYRTQKTVHYIQGDTSLKSAVTSVNRMENGAGFFFAPLTYKRLISILDRGHLVVPKSTYFEPRMRNGIVVQTL